MAEAIKVAAKTPEAKSVSPAAQIRKAGLVEATSLPGQVLMLQSSVGNQAVGRLLETRAIQAKLEISQPGDFYEREADRIANQVMRMPDPEPLPSAAVSGGSQSPRIQRLCSGCQEEEKTVQTKPLADQATSVAHRQVDPEQDAEEEIVSEEGEQDGEEEIVAGDEEDEIVQTQQAPGKATTPSAEPMFIESMREGGGQMLPAGARDFMESRFGRDFSWVRVHTSSRAAESAQTLNARAYTVGSNIVFGVGQYAPDTNEGRHLLAHELTHVVQQGGDEGVRGKRRIQRLTCATAGVRPRAIPAPIDFVTSLTVGDPARARIRQNLDTDDITATAKLADRLNDSTIFNKMSLLDVGFGHGIRVGRRRGRTRVSVNVSVRFPNLHITREFPRNGCHFRIVRQHEIDHRPIIDTIATLEQSKLDTDLNALPQPTNIQEVERLAIEWCDRTRPRVESSIVDRHNFDLPNIQQQFLACPPLAMTGCNRGQQAVIATARDTARTWLAGTIGQLAAVPLTSAVGTGLNQHFNTQAPPVPDHVVTADIAARIRRFQAIQRDFSQILAALNGNELRFACVNGARGPCANPNTYGFSGLGGFRVNICTRRFHSTAMSDDDRAAGLIHETHHAAVPGSLDETTEVYEHNVAQYPPAADDAIHNPDSYAEFARDVH